MGSIWKAVTGYFKQKEKMEKEKKNENNAQVQENEEDEDSDSEDEDFVPNEANEAAGSEELSDGDGSDDDDDYKGKKTVRKSKKIRKRRASKKPVFSGIRSKRGKFVNPDEVDDDKGDLAYDANNSPEPDRSDGDDNGFVEEAVSKEVSAEQEALEKAETDRLWSDFLTSVNEEKERKGSKDRTVEKVVNKVYDFAGQKVSVQEKVKVTVSNSKSGDNAKVEGIKSVNEDSQSSISTAISDTSSNNTEKTTATNDDEPTPGPSSAMRNGNSSSNKPKIRRGGISILGNDPEAIGLDELDKRGLSGLLKAFQTKSKKIGTLEKSKLDWESFKRQQGLEEELQSHNKSRDVFIDKQEFLQRADYRQFELEKTMRATARSRRLAN